MYFLFVYLYGEDKFVTATHISFFFLVISRFFFNFFSLTYLLPLMHVLKFKASVLNPSWLTDLEGLNLILGLLNGGIIVFIHFPFSVFE